MSQVTKTKNPRNAGRKPLSAGERKKTVQCFPKEAAVEAIGYEKCQEIALKAIEEEYAKIIFSGD